MFWHFARFLIEKKLIERQGGEEFYAPLIRGGIPLPNLSNKNAGIETDVFLQDLQSTKLERRLFDWPPVLINNCL